MHASIRMSQNNKQETNNHPQQIKAPFSPHEPWPSFHSPSSYNPATSHSSPTPPKAPHKRVNNYVSSSHSPPSNSPSIPPLPPIPYWAMPPVPRSRCRSRPPYPPRILFWIGGRSACRPWAPWDWILFQRIDTFRYVFGWQIGPRTATESRPLRLRLRLRIRLGQRLRRRCWWCRFRRGWGLVGARRVRRLCHHGVGLTWRDGGLNRRI